MIGAGAFFSVMNLCVRLASQEGVPTVQIVFFRNLFAFLALLPWVASHGFATVRTKRVRAHVLRAMLGITAMFLWFTSVTVLPLAQAVALNFTFPLFATILAVLVLKEVVRLRRWTATAIGFLGVLIILRPWNEGLQPLLFLPIAAAFFMASAAIAVKRLSATESPVTVVFYMNLFMTPASLIPAIPSWTWPSGMAWICLIALGLFAMLSHLMLVRAYALADASLIQPFDYLRLPFTALIGYLVFAEVPSPWLWVGAAVIAGSTFYIARREAQLARQSVRPHAP